MTGQNWPDGVAAKGRAQWGQFVYEVAFQFQTLNEILKILKMVVYIRECVSTGAAHRSREGIFNSFSKMIFK